MKKLILSITLVLCAILSGFAEKEGVYTTFHKYGNPQTSGAVERKPAKVNVEIYYDNDENLLEIIADDGIIAEIFVYNSDNELELYSPEVNTVLEVASNGTHRVVVKSQYWYLEGFFNVEDN